MKKVVTIASCLALLTFGWIIGHNDDTKPMASPPAQQVVLPVDMQLTMYKNAVESLTNKLQNKIDSVTQHEVSNPDTIRVPVPYRVVQEKIIHYPLVFIAKQATEEQVEENHSANDSVRIIE